MDKYTELYAWIWKAFGKDPFSIDQFRSTFPTSQGPKVAHDLVKKGYLKRIGRGIYAVVEPNDFIERIGEAETDFSFLEKAGKEYAFCDSTAVSLWTDGYYWTGFTKGYRPINLAIRKKDQSAWKEFFHKAGIRCALEGENKTLYGQVFILHPKKHLAYQQKEGLRVAPLDEVVNYCLRHELAFEPALEYLDEKYKIGYSIRERVM